MADLARRDAFQPNVQAIGVYYGNPVALDGYMRRLWRIVPDPPDYEFIQSPAYQVDLAIQNGFYQGDCDDAATLAASFLYAIDWPSSFIAIRLAHEENFSHVFLRAPLLEYAPGEFFDMDVIVPEDQLPIRDYAESMTVRIL